jgi:hypothetical protein
LSNQPGSRDNRRIQLHASTLAAVFYSNRRAIGENLLVNAVMKASDGRLSAFQPMADDDGIDCLFYDKETGNAVAIQLKCRTGAIRKRNSKERGNVVHF